jgi:DNA-binding CsgD family transcriptional regulator
LSNKQIAQTLFISPKTVEAQLSRTYAKLSIGGRAQLASALAAKQ